MWGLFHHHQRDSRKTLGQVSSSKRQENKEYNIDLKIFFLFNVALKALHLHDKHIHDSPGHLL